MKILVISPAYQFFPIGIGYIAAVLKKAGHEVTCHVFRDSESLASILETPFDYAATGGLSFQYPQISLIARQVKASGMRLVIGGGIVTSEPELIVRALNADYAVIGEGEHTILELSEALEARKPVETVAGVAYVHHGKFHFTGPRKEIMDLDALPYPDYSSFNMEEYLDGLHSSDQWYDIFDFPRVLPFLTSRSCPFSCTFCYHPIGQKYRQRSLDSIFDELAVTVPRFRINLVNLFDELLSFDEPRVLEFCQRFKALADSLSWELAWTCSLRVNDVTPRMLDALKDSGCFLVAYGFESYSATILQSMKKHITPDQIHYAIHETLNRGISIQANFLFGDPAETLETAQETLDFWYRHREAGILLIFVIPCPDSEIYRHCLKKGLIKDRLEFISQKLFDPINMTSLSESDFWKVRSQVASYTHQYSIYAIPREKGRDFVVVECPFCQSVNRYGNYQYSRLMHFHMSYCRVCRKRFFIVSGAYKILARLVGFLFGPRVYKAFAWLKRTLALGSPRSVFHDLWHRHGEAGSSVSLANKCPEHRSHIPGEKQV